MTVQHQSYLELKEETGDEFARRALLYNLKCCRNNVRATARVMRCSPHTVYRAMRKKDEGNLKDTSHKPKSRHPRHLEDEKEQMIIEYRTKTKLGKKRLRYFIFKKMSIDIAESTIGKVIKRHNLQRKKRKRVRRSRASPFYDMERLFQL